MIGKPYLTVACDPALDVAIKRTMPGKPHGEGGTRQTGLAGNARTSSSVRK